MSGPPDAPGEDRPRAPAKRRPRAPAKRRSRAPAGNRSRTAAEAAPPDLSAASWVPPAASSVPSADRDRGQAHTLEAVAAAAILMASVLFALQATAVTPLSASSAHQSIESQQAHAAAGVLDAAHANGSLRRTLLYWNASDRTFHRTTERGYYVDGGPPTAFGAALNETFLARGHAFNVNVHYVSRAGTRRSEQLVHFGSPSDRAVSVTRTVTLTDDDALRAADGTAAATTVSDTSSFYAPDASPSSPLYAVVRVEVVVWRM